MEALNCIRHSLYYAPNDMRDIPLISLANVMHRSGKYNDGQHQSTSSYPLLSLGLYNDAIIAANMALEISPSFVVSHFTLANIYTSKKDLEKAKLFYVVSKFIRVKTGDNSLPSTSQPSHSRRHSSPPWKGWPRSSVDRSSSEETRGNGDIIFWL